MTTKVHHEWKAVLLNKSTFRLGPNRLALPQILALAILVTMSMSVECSFSVILFLSVVEILCHKSVTESLQ